MHEYLKKIALILLIFNLQTYPHISDGFIPYAAGVSIACGIKLISTHDTVQKKIVQPTHKIADISIDNLSALSGIVGTLATQYFNSQDPEAKKLYAQRIGYCLGVSTLYQLLSSKKLQSSLKKLPILNALTCQHCQSRCNQCDAKKFAISCGITVLINATFA